MSSSELCVCAPTHTLISRDTHTHTHALSTPEIKSAPSGEPCANFSPFKFSETHWAHPDLGGHPSLHRLGAFWCRVSAVLRLGDRGQPDHATRTHVWTDRGKQVAQARGLVVTQAGFCGAAASLLCCL